jgi:hypothetical protein
MRFRTEAVSGMIGLGLPDRGNELAKVKSGEKEEHGLTPVPSFCFQNSISSV